MKVSAFSIPAAIGHHWCWDCFSSCTQLNVRPWFPSTTTSLGLHSWAFTRNFHCRKLARKGSPFLLSSSQTQFFLQSKERVIVIFCEMLTTYWAGLIRTSHICSSVLYELCPQSMWSSILWPFMKTYFVRYHIAASTSYTTDGHFLPYFWVKTIEKGLKTVNIFRLSCKTWPFTHIYCFVCKLRKLPVCVDSGHWRCS